MNRNIITALSAVVMVMIVFAIFWALDVLSLGSIFSGVSAAIGAMIILINGTMLIQIAVLAWIFLVEEITLQIAAGLVLVPWMSSLIIWYLSLVYYYRK